MSRYLVACALLVLGVQGRIESAFRGRFGHSSVYLSSLNKILVIGGQTSTNASVVDPHAVYEIDLEVGINSILPSDIVIGGATAPLGQSYSSCSAETIKKKERAICFFGFDHVKQEATQSMFAYNLLQPGLLAETINATKAAPRYEAAVTALSPSKIFIHGGVTGNEQNGLFPNSETLIYDNVLEQLLLVATDGPSPRWQHTASTLSDGRVVLLGGTTNHKDTVPLSDIWVYDPPRNRYVRSMVSGEVPRPRRDHSAIAVNNTVIVYGGTNSSNFSIIYSDIWKLDVDSMVWTKLFPKDNVRYPIFPDARYAHSANLVQDSMVVLFGYKETDKGGEITNEVHVFDLISETWTPVDSFNGVFRGTLRETGNGSESKNDLGVILGATFGVIGSVIAFAYFYVRFRSAKRRDITDPSKVRVIDGTAGRMDDTIINMSVVDESRFSFESGHPSWTVNATSSKTLPIYMKPNDKQKSVLSTKGRPLPSIPSDC